MIRSGGMRSEYNWVARIESQHKHGRLNVLFLYNMIPMCALLKYCNSMSPLDEALNEASPMPLAERKDAKSLLCAIGYFLSPSTPAIKSKSTGHSFRWPWRDFAVYKWPP